MNAKKVIIAIVLLLVACGVGLTAVVVVRHMIRTNPARARLVHGKMPVRVTRTTVRTIDDMIGASGQTREFESITITARIVQPVIRVGASMGDRVKSDQVIATFDDRVPRAAVVEAEQRVANAKANLENKKLNYSRLENLHKQKLIARVELEQAAAEVQESQLDLANANLQLQKTSQDLSYTVVRSPVDGIVLERPINVGETPRVDTPLVILGLIDNILMLANVPEDKLAYIQLNQTAEVSFDSFRNEVFKGLIVKINPSVDPKTRTFIVYIKIPNQTYKLTPGLTGFARIKNSRTSLSVPSLAVLNPIGEVASVFILDDRLIATIRAVKIGVTAGGITEIVDGLKEGDRVVTAGIQNLKDGDQIEIMEEQP
jgi:RND family efflux transporter MFP subunit